jgi:uncharacterized protein with HEPN domain
MLSEDARGHLLDILHEIELAESFADGLTEAEFLQSLLHLRATTRCREIISEASRRLPNDLKGRNAHIDWRVIAGAGNVYRHDYGNVAPRRIWETVTQSLPLLREVVEAELRSAN